MLVLSRKSSQTIHINDQIVITIMRVAGRQVQVGIEAPDEMRILRGELVKHALQEAESLSQPPANHLTEAAPAAAESQDVAKEVVASSDIWEDFAALYMADGDVAASFDQHEDQVDPIEPTQRGLAEQRRVAQQRARILPLRRLERRFPMGIIRPTGPR